MPAAPFPFSTFVGRNAELARIREGLKQCTFAAIVGAGGVGKSALAQAFANQWVGVVVHRVATADDSSSILLDDLRRRLAQGPIAQAESDEQRLEELVELADSQAALILIDDANRLSAQTLKVTLHELPGRLRHARLLATSRELLPRSSSMDSVEIRLGGLDEEAGRGLWASLDTLYGAADGFDCAWARSRGSPLLLRRAHAEELGEDADPIGTTIASLTREQRWLAGALALSEIRLPVEPILASDPSAKDALKVLTRRLIAEVDGSGLLAVHDLFREAIASRLSAEERRDIHQALSRWVRGLPIDPVVRARELIRHLAVAAEWEPLADYVLEQSTELIRLGAVADLLRGFDSIPAEHRSDLVKVARADAGSHGRSRQRARRAPPARPGGDGAPGRFAPGVGPDRDADGSAR